jgi:hypothetical protein
MSVSTVYLGAAVCPVQSETCSLCRASSGSARVGGPPRAVARGWVAQRPVARSLWLFGSRAACFRTACAACAGLVAQRIQSAAAQTAMIVTSCVKASPCGEAGRRDGVQHTGCSYSSQVRRSAALCSMPCAVVEAQRARLVATWRTRRGPPLSVGASRAREPMAEAVLAARRRRSVLTRCGAAFAGLRARCAAHIAFSTHPSEVYIPRNRRRG